MKIQSLAIIFIIIVLPISLVLATYTQYQSKTLNLQSTYDSRLIDSTYDAVKAFQINTLSNTSSDVASSKIRDIEASANAFFDSVADNFGLSEYNSDTIKQYVPALVYTLYDGYYIYSPYTNTININNSNKDDDIKLKDSSTYKNGETLQGLKPYVYYSCRYIPNSNSDFVITYALDNYITIQGKINGESVNKSGYLLNNIGEKNGNPTYRGIEITTEYVSEDIVQSKTKTKTLPYVQINGVKYYRDENKVFSIVNGNKIYLSPNTTNQFIGTYFADGNKNKSAQNYYKKAKEFTEYVTKNTTLKQLTYGDARDEKGNRILNTEGKEIAGLSGNEKVFLYNTTISIEDAESNFNEHRTAVIRYSIQKNLAAAIANFNSYSNSTNEFQMPNLSEEDWYSIINDVSIISFMQGVSIGGKIYNGYAVVTNNKTQEVVAEDSIYIINSQDEYYSTIKENGLNEKSGLIGYFNVDFEKKEYKIKDGSNTKSYYCYPHGQLGSYESVVNQTSVTSYTDVYKHLKDKPNLAKSYYTALGRERYGMYRVNYDIYIK